MQTDPLNSPSPQNNLNHLDEDLCKQWMNNGRSSDHIQQALEKYLESQGKDRKGKSIEKPIHWLRSTASKMRLQEAIRQSQHVYFDGLLECQRDILLPPSDRPDVMAHLADIRRHLPQLLERFETIFLTKLRGLQREVVILWNVEQIEKFEYIALKLGTTLPAVYRAHYQGMQKLNQLLQKEIKTWPEAWPVGNELFARVLADPRNLPGLFMLRLIQAEGADGLDSAVQSAYSGTRMYVPDKRRSRKK